MTSAKTEIYALDDLPCQTFDAVVIGAGGAGMRASLMLAEQGLDVAMVSKVFPTRSHTVAAQGGINAALANVTPDNWQWHMYDTIKGSDYLGDQDAIEFMCMQAAQTVRELEHFGVPFSRLQDGKIYQRAFGGQSQNYGGEQAKRTCAAADRTGHAILHTLYQQNIRQGTQIFSEFFATDLLTDSAGAVRGVVIMSIETGDYQILLSPHIMLATGGAGQIFRTNTNASINTGDGLGMAARIGVPLQDMEFWQFHPTGVAGKGMLMSEAARGEGGVLRNADGEAFMVNYAPNVKDLASRDVVSRAIAEEVNAGRGCGPNKDYVLLDLTQLDAEVVKERLPGIRDISLTFLNIDPVEEPVPVFPTCHYMMGGIPTDLNGQVTTLNENGESEVVNGLYAIGECACVSVHGANRLGGNSLLDIVVFGKKAAQTIIEKNQHQTTANISLDDIDSKSMQRAITRIQHWQNFDNTENSNTKTEKADNAGTDDSVLKIKQDLQKVMEQGVSVFRKESTMQAVLPQLEAIKQRIQQVKLVDQSNVFNLERLQALELDNLMAVAEATAYSALSREESRGAHSRIDFKVRNDKEWLKHSLYFCADKTVRFKDVNMQPQHHEPFAPKQRVY